MQYRAKEKGWPFWPGGKGARVKSETDAIMRFIRLMDEFCRFSEKISRCYDLSSRSLRIKMDEENRLRKGFGLCAVLIGCLG